jgi:hypothetical protein
MTRKPIIVTITTILAVGLLVGLAYGAGRNTGARNGYGHATTAANRVVARHVQDHRVGPMTRTRMLAWINGWMPDHCCRGVTYGSNHRFPVRHHDTWMSPGYVPASGPSVPSQTPSTGTGSGSVNHYGYGSGDRHHGDHRSYGGSHHDGGWHHDCW